MVRSRTEGNLIWGAGLALQTGADLERQALLLAQALHERQLRLAVVDVLLLDGHVGLELLTDALADPHGAQPLQVRMAFEEEDPVDEQVGVLES